ncbi:putative Werner syndrome helicase [Naviculisporaceae sp. PSN 640]
MESQERKSNVWHLSRGIVFAGDTRVVYPRLPTARFYSAPAMVSHSEYDSSLTTGSVTSAGSRVDNGQVPEAQSLVASDTNSSAQPAADEGTKANDSSAEIEKSTDAEKPEEDPKDIEPPYTPLDYKIPSEVFRAAKQAPEGSMESYWSYNLYRGPDEKGELNTKIKVHYCTSLHTTERVLQQYFVNEKILGFDLEWEASASDRMGARKNVSLVQIASESRIGLFHLSLYREKGSLVAPSLKKIMEDPGITKLGVAIKGDCTRLRKFLGIDSRGVFELSNLYKLVKYSTSKEYQFINRTCVRLAVQVMEYLHLPLHKGPDVRKSNWSQALKMDQIIYSASDAYAAVQLYAVLDHHRQNLDPTPPLPYFVEENKPIRLADGVLLPSSEEEPAPQEDDTAVANTTPGPSDKYLDSLKDTVEIECEGEAEAEGDESNASILPPAQQTPRPSTSITTTTTTTKPIPTPPKDKDKRILTAEALATEYRSTKPLPAGAKPNSYAKQSQLRAYFLWRDNADLGPKEIAELLRNPPLQTSTVLGYILETIRLEKMSYDRKRLREDLLGCVAKEVLAGSRYYQGFLHRD